MTFKKCFYSFLLVLICCSTNLLYSHTEIEAKNDIKNLIKKATDLMRNEKYEESLLLSRKILSDAIAKKDNNLIALNYNTIATNFDQLGEYEKALFYYRKSLIFANKTNNSELKSWLYNNLGNIHCFDKKEFGKGIYYYKKSLLYSTRLGDSSEIFLTKFNITWAYFDIRKFELGQPYLNYINKHHKKDSDSSTLVIINMLNGMYQSHLNNIKAAESYFKKAIELGLKDKDKSDLSYAHQEYATFLFKTKKFKQAYENLDTYNSITTQLKNEERLKKLNIIGVNLEIDEYKREIDNIKIEYKTNHELLIEKQSKNKVISIVIISILLTIIILSYLYFQNVQLKQKNKIRDIENKIQENIITATINGQEMERKKIASFLHDNISALLSSASLHLKIFSTKNNTNSEEITKTKSILIQTHYKIRDLSHQLLPSLLARFGLFHALNDLCETNSNSSLQFNFSNNIPDETQYNDEFEMKMYFIVSELINNIIKHSQASRAKIDLKEIDSNLHILVKDNGIGFEIKNFRTIEGFGLNQIRARINTMGGKFRIISEPTKGTTIKIIVPIEYNL